MEINFTGNSATGYDNPRRPPMPTRSKPLQGDLQRNAQRLVPGNPNNGNPQGANNMPSYQNALNQGAKPMPGGYGDKPQTQVPPMPRTLESMFPGVPSSMLDGDMEANLIRQYNLANQRGRFDPMYGIMQADSATEEDRRLMNLPVNAYQNQYNPDGTSRIDAIINAMRGGNTPFSAPSPASPAQGMGYAPSPVGQFQGNSPQGYWDQGQNPEWGRYIPPMMRNAQNPTDWYFSGGYNYNLPGAGGRFPTQGGFLNPSPPNINRPPVPYPGG